MARRALSGRPTVRGAVRWTLALVYLIAGLLHLAAPAPFVRVTPVWVPQPLLVVYLTGLAEIIGAIGLLQNRSTALRRWAGLGLAAYALCVWPANFEHLRLDLARTDGGLGLAYHVPRLLAQPLIIWLALWAGEVTQWPFARRRS